MQSCGVENNSAIGRLPRTWLNDTECMLSGGTRVVSSDAAVPVATVSVAMSGGRWPTSGIGEVVATAISPGAPIRPFVVRVSERT